MLVKVKTQQDMVLDACNSSTRETEVKFQAVLDSSVRSHFPGGERGLRMKLTWESAFQAGVSPVLPKPAGVVHP